MLSTKKTRKKQTQGPNQRQLFDPNTSSWVPKCMRAKPQVRSGDVLTQMDCGRAYAAAQAWKAQEGPLLRRTGESLHQLIGRGFASFIRFFVFVSVFLGWGDG